MNATQGEVLVVGATGRLGGQVVRQLLARGTSVRALVRPTSAHRDLQAPGVGVHRGDLLDPDSLVRAMDGVDAVVSTAAGYTGRDRRADAIDTTGQANLAWAASCTGVRRFVYTSILTCDQMPTVAHSWRKKLAEDHLERLAVPFVALRPGAFLDQMVVRGGNPLRTRRLPWVGRTDVPLTFVLTADLARYLAAAVDADVDDGERIDIGWRRPLAMADVARLMGQQAGMPISVRAVPPAVASIAAATLGSALPTLRDRTEMFRWFDSGRYVADVRRQCELFGPPPAPEEAMGRLLADLGVRVTR